MWELFFFFLDWGLLKVGVTVFFRFLVVSFGFGGGGLMGEISRLEFVDGEVRL